ncbi:MAG: hypothetical protein D6808_02770, partial [Candidatus Dadabacteria bacterium]
MRSSSKAHRRTLRFVKLSLIAGIALGLCIIVAKSIIKYHLVEMLNEMVERSTRCTFKAKRSMVSFIPLKAVAINPQIRCKGNSPVKFKKLTAHFNIKDITKGIVYLSELRLDHGHLKGIGPSSVIYKFIDFLAEPISPERRDKVKIRIKMKRLLATDITFREPLKKYTLLGKGAKITVARDNNGNFVLSPYISSLSIIPSGKSISTASYPLGNLNSSITLYEN